MKVKVAQNIATKMIVRKYVTKKIITDYGGSSIKYKNVLLRGSLAISLRVRLLNVT